MEVSGLDELVLAFCRLLRRLGRYASDIPKMEVEHQETPSPFTPLGTTGMGESGATGPPGSLCGAIENALPHLDLKLSEMPLTPHRVWQAVQHAQQAHGGRT